MILSTSLIEFTLLNSTFGPVQLYSLHSLFLIWTGSFSVCVMGRPGWQQRTARTTSMRRYIRTTNAIESLFSNVRQRTDQITAPSHLRKCFFRFFLASCQLRSVCRIDSRCPIVKQEKRLGQGRKTFSLPALPDGGEVFVFLSERL